jgi:hypothetical protein
LTSNTPATPVAGLRPIKARTGRQDTDLPENPNGYCPNHSTGVTFPNIVVTPLQYVD